MQLWFVDDKLENHTTWANSFSQDITESCELLTFLSVAEVIDELDSGNIPDILFLDFFIGRRIGVDLIRRFRNEEVRPVLIAHSSMQAANEGMVAAGADFALEKIKYKPHTASIRNAFRNVEDVAWIVKHRAVRGGP